MLRWWGQPDRFLWLSNYLSVNGALRATRLAIGVAMAGMAAAPVLMLLSLSGPTAPASRLAFLGVAGSAAALSVLWLLRWPTRVQSVLFGLITTVQTAVVCLLLPDPLWGVMACAAFTGGAAYLALMHTSAYLVAALVMAQGCAAARSLELAARGDPWAAAAAQLTLLVMILTPTVAGRILINTLGADAAESEVDTLTGLRNRRGFYREAHALVLRLCNDVGGRLGVIVIDLDKFKRINDTHGHAVGDRVLTAVGEVIGRTVTDSGAVAARLGGEEFAIAGAYDPRRATELAERLRRSIAELPYAITASVGVVSAPVPPITEPRIRLLLDQFVNTADHAMYDAKQAGGDRVCRRPGFSAQR